MAYLPVDQNLRESFRILARAQQRGEVREFAGLTIASAGVAFQMFNAAFLAGPVTAAADMERRVAAATIHFRTRGLGWSFWLCDDLLDPALRGKVERAFARWDVSRVVRLPGMIADRIAPPRRPLAPLEIRPALDAATRQAFCTIGSLCFHVPVLWFEEIFLGEAAWSGGFRGYVGYREGEPVATAATVVSDSAAGLYNVATLPAFQRRGFAETVVRHALSETYRATGIEQSVLQSTEAGLSLYARLGYRPVTGVTVFAS